MSGVSERVNHRRTGGVADCPSGENNKSLDHQSAAASGTLPPSLTLSSLCLYPAALDSPNLIPKSTFCHRRRRRRREILRGKLDGPRWRVERRESELPEAAIGGQLGETFPVSFKMEFGQGKGEEEEKGRGQTVPISATRSVFSKTAMIPGRTTSNSAAKKVRRAVEVTG